MKRCNLNREDIAAYCCGEFDFQRRSKIKEHLGNCKECLSRVQKLQKMFSLVEGQKLKEIPVQLLNNYTQETCEKLNPSAGITFLLKERLTNFLDNLSFIFSPKFIPVSLAVCAAVFVFVVLQQGKAGLVDLINKDIVLLEQISEDTQEDFLLESDEGLFAAMQSEDAIVFVQLEDEAESEDIFYDLELLQELDEEINGDNLTEDLKLLDELEMEVG